MVKRLDKNGNGKIDYEELVEGLRVKKKYIIKFYKNIGNGIQLVLLIMLHPHEILRHRLGLEIIS